MLNNVGLIVSNVQVAFSEIIGRSFYEALSEQNTTSAIQSYVTGVLIDCIIKSMTKIK